MIVVYKGDTQSININNKTYDRNTPTFIAPYQEVDIVSRDDFGLYDSGEKYPGEKRVIKVTMPGDIEFFISAINVLRRIKDYYPLCNIYVICQDIYKSILPDFAINKTHSEINKNDIYREFDLYVQKKMVDKWHSQYKFTCHEHMLLEKLNLFSAQKDKDKKVSIWEDYEKDGSVVIFKSGDSIKGTWNELSDCFNYNYDKTTYIDEPLYDKESIAKYFQMFKSSNYVVFLGETKLTLLAAYCGCKVFTGILKTGYNKAVKLCGAFETVRGNYIESPTKPVAEIADTLNLRVQESVVGYVYPEPSNTKSLESNSDPIDDTKLEYKPKKTKKNKKRKNP